nr:MAG TPA: hypothetical protein [Bacteriophage sp.]
MLLFFFLWSLSGLLSNKNYHILIFAHMQTKSKSRLDMLRCMHEKLIDRKIGMVLSFNCCMKRD